MDFGLWTELLVRWFHVLSGVMWIGLLWYFNFVQIPTVPKIPDELKPAIGKHIAPVALFWFRWGRGVDGCLGHSSRADGGVFPEPVAARAYRRLGAT